MQNAYVRTDQKITFQLIFIQLNNLENLRWNDVKADPQKVLLTLLLFLPKILVVTLNNNLEN